MIAPNNDTNCITPIGSTWPIESPALTIGGNFQTTLHVEAYPGGFLVTTFGAHTLPGKRIVVSADELAEVVKRWATLT